MKLRTAIKILRSNNNYWCRQVDDYDIRGIKNKAYIASRRIIRSLNKYIKTVKKNEHKYEEIINKKDIKSYRK